ncbi:MAG: glycosyltransferase [Saprospiraceae bacterium]
MNLIKPYIIYEYADKASFVQKDIEILAIKYEVLSEDIDWKTKYKTPFNILVQTYFYIKNIKKSKAIFVMFGGYWALVPVIMAKYFKKPCFIILGGTDCMSFPSLNYGNLRIPLLRTILRKVYENATCLLPVHKSLIECDNNYYLQQESKQGILNNLKGININFSEIYNGFNSKEFNKNEAKRKKNRFISIASIDSDIRYILKGGDLIFKLADIYPNYEFVLVGISENYLKKIKKIPQNLKIISFCHSEKIVDLLKSSTFYLQLSISEGFPNSLAEAMLCGCIPIGSDVGAIPEIIDDKSRIVKKRDIYEVCSIINTLLEKSEIELKSLSDHSYSRILNNFSIEKRQKSLLDIIEKYEIH